MPNFLVSLFVSLLCVMFFYVCFLVCLFLCILFILVCVSMFVCICHVFSCGFIVGFPIKDIVVGGQKEGLYDFIQKKFYVSVLAFTI